MLNFFKKKRKFEGFFWNKEARLVKFETLAKSEDDLIKRLKKKGDYFAMCVFCERGANV